jgi:hypothetical protein
VSAAGGAFVQEAVLRSNFYWEQAPLGSSVQHTCTACGISCKISPILSILSILSILQEAHARTSPFPFNSISLKKVAAESD